MLFVNESGTTGATTMLQPTVAAETGGGVTIDFSPLLGDECTALSLSRSGNLALLTGGRTLALVDMHRPEGPLLAKVANAVQRKVRETQFSFGSEGLCAVAADELVELVEWVPDGRLCSLADMRRHTRGIEDLSWHEQSTDMLATCSVENFIYVWDRRSPRRPSNVLESVSGASQVCWERIAGNVLASSHGGEIRLWDIRTAKAPYQYINAHLEEILAMDFSTNRRDYLVSSSQDYKVKFWNVSIDHGHPERELLVPQSPVWKVRYTPFGEGLVTLSLNTVSRGENSVKLWNASKLNSPVYTFFGHRDVVTEFCWQNCDQEGGRDKYNLVSWGQNAAMRIWPIHDHIRNMCSEGEPVEDRCPLATIEAIIPEVAVEKEPSSLPDTLPCQDNEADSILVTPAEHADSPDSLEPTSLDQEFRLINFRETLELEQRDSRDRFCVISAKTSKHVAYLHVRFPNRYPIKEPPVFTFLEATTLPEDKRQSILDRLNHSANLRAFRMQRCMELCMRDLESAIQRIKDQERREDGSSKDDVESSPVDLLGGLQDANVPYPRTCGAQFCGAGQLVVFRMPTSVQVVGKTSGKTPRALSAISNENLPLYTKPRRTTERYNRRSTKTSLGSSTSEDQGAGKDQQQVAATSESRVVIFNTMKLQPFNKSLATKYRLSGAALSQLCNWNAGLALQCNKVSVAETWLNLALSLKLDKDGLWETNPLGKQLLRSKLRSHLAAFDFQTVAAVVCAVESSRQRKLRDLREARRQFEQSAASVRPTRSRSSKSECSSSVPSYTDSGRDDAMEAVAFGLTRSASEHQTMTHAASGTSALLASLPPPPSGLFGTNPFRGDTFKADEALAAYRELLGRLRLAYNCTEVRKFSRLDDEPLACVFACQRTAESSKCVVCDVSVRGVFTSCLSCGHGGHFKHLKLWFVKKSACARSGCRCRCTGSSAGGLE